MFLTGVGAIKVTPILLCLTTVYFLLCETSLALELLFTINKWIFFQ